jgi:acyl-CoA dehydrogenase
MLPLVLAAVIGLVLGFALYYHGRTKAGWIVPIAIVLGVWGQTALARGHLPIPFYVVAALFLAAILFLAITPIRRVLITPAAMRAIAPVLPRMSETERIALEAGTVWWDADLFSGAPSWEKWLANPPAKLSDRERAFLDGPCDELCRMVSDWDVTARGDLSERAWRYIRDNGFFAMIIPRSYGGLEFSAQANSAVVTKLATRSTGLAVTVMVPNSLGPAELLLHYGTDEQKNYYLPRLARAEEIPCFALTEPTAGSDATGMKSSGVVCRGTFEGREVVGIRLNWEKRYITLAPVATLLGLAFKLYDPERLLGGNEDLGITCALIPTTLPGIDIGKRHDPLSVPFLNGPTRGKDVFIPVDFIIGGPAMAGQGWKMLMQCLSAGRGISLPSLSAGAAQLSTRTVGAYTTVREQFNLPLGQFEGVQEALARIGGMTYAVDSLRRVTAASIDAGEKPSVISAIAKAYSTEAMRKVVNDAMDACGGAGISMGPSNVIGRAYMSLPIGITVEGANILTRTMIIFGQGALRCHPFAQHEVQAVASKDLAAFDRAFFGHMGFVVRNKVRSLILGVTDGAIVSVPVGGQMGRTLQRLSRMSAAFAFCADVAMATLGGTLKRRERLTGRLADALSWLYIGSTIVKRFVDDGQPERDRPYASWASALALKEIETALTGFLDNLPAKPVAALTRAIIFPLGARYRGPSDRVGTLVAEGLLEGRPPRTALSPDVFIPPASEPGLGQLEACLEKVLEARPARQAIKKALRERTLSARPSETLLERAVQAGIIDSAQRGLVEEEERARAIAIAVDEFTSLGHAPPALANGDGNRGSERPASRGTPVAQHP